MAIPKEAQTVLDFWIGAGQKAWFTRDEAFDQRCAAECGQLHARAAAREFEGWRDSAQGSLALVLLLDQFSRNMYRTDARAFAQDSHALEVASEALAKGYDLQVAPELKFFFFMPFMHSESILDQQRCVSMFHGLGGEQALNYAILHRDIIARFGRFPHRNPKVGRHMTPAEQAYLDSGGFSA